MAQKHPRGKRDARKPRQKKSKAVATTSFPALHSNPARSFIARRK